MKGLSSVGNGMELRALDDMTLEDCQSRNVLGELFWVRIYSDRSGQ